MNEKSMDPAQVTPATHKVVFENERLRVLDIRLSPGQKAPMHSHPGYLVYCVTPGQVKFSFPDGKTEDLVFQSGMVGWREAESHAAENVGPHEIHVLNVELKG